MHRLKKYLIQQYPLEENIWKIIIPISLFVGLFMLIFQPFGLDGFQSSNKYLILTGYGLVTFLVLIVNLWLIPSVLPALFREESWTVLKEIFFLLWILFTVGLANLLYSSWTMGFPLSFTNILAFQTYTLAVGILPITTLTLVKQHYLKRKNEANAEILSHSINERHTSLTSAQIVLFSSDNVRENLELAADQILFIKAEGNYITIAYLKNGKIGRTLFRNTMKYASDLLAPFPFFYQCHRSWIVNLNCITGISGNSQGLRLRLESFDEDIPVARNNTAIFKKIMTEKRA
jgi:hypothetical protein